MGMRAAATAHSAVREKGGVRTLHNRSQLQRWHLSCTHRIKLLLAVCIVFALFAIAQRASSIMGWHIQPTGSNHLPATRNSYTLLVNTWKRNDLLKKSVAHYSSCGSVDAIRIVWSEEEPPSDALWASLLSAVHGKSNDFESPFLRFDVHANDSLNNRFKPLEGLRTGAIFSIDDDVLVPCSLLEFAFSIWQTAPDSMVGFVPRMHWSITKKQGHNQLRYVYGGWWSVWWTGTYSMVLTKAAILHYKYLEMYTKEMPSSIRDFVRDRRQNS